MQRNLHREDGDVRMHTASNTRTIRITDSKQNMQNGNTKRRSQKSRSQVNKEEAPT